MRSHVCPGKWHFSGLKLQDILPWEKRERTGVSLACRDGNVAGEPCHVGWQCHLLKRHRKKAPIKRKWNISCSNMEGILLSKITQTDRQILYNITYRI